MRLARLGRGTWIVVLFTLVLVSGIIAQNPAFWSLSGKSPSKSPIPTIQSGPTGITQLGFDCGLGTTIAVPNATGVPLAPSEANNASSAVQNRCTWIGDAGQTVSTVNDGTTEPLVTDQDEVLSLIGPGIGGGFTANVIVIQNSTASINGFDLQVKWNPAVLHLVEFDQTGLAWRSVILLTAVQTIDNTNGSAELAQVISGTFNKNLTIFRLRFDVVGIGLTSLHLVDISGGLTNPGPVIHQTTDSSFDSD